MSDAITLGDGNLAAHQCPGLKHLLKSEGWFLVGLLALSRRTFFVVFGASGWIRRHIVLNPRTGSIPVLSSYYVAGSVLQRFNQRQPGWPHAS